MGKFKVFISSTIEIGNDFPIITLFNSMFGFSYHNWWAYRYYVCEFLSLVNVIGKRILNIIFYVTCSPPSSKNIIDANQFSQIFFHIKRRFINRVIRIGKDSLNRRCYTDILDNIWGNP